jgi:TPR repeat protein
MVMRQHKRPLWIGLLACAVTPPVIYCALTKILLLRLPFLADSVQVWRILGLFFLIGMFFSLAMTFSVGLLVIIFLKRFFRLSAVYVCIAGTLSGALFAFLLQRSSQLQSHSTIQLPLHYALSGISLGVIEMAAWVGLLATGALCLVSGIPICSIRRDQIENDRYGSLAPKLSRVFTIIVIAVSAWMLKPIGAPLLSPNKLTVPNMPTTPPRAVDAKSWDRTCPKQYASPDEPDIELINTDVAQLAIETSDGDTTALHKLLQFADSGNELAQSKLGRFYEGGCHEGHGIPRDTTQAAHWYERSALQGNAESALRLGLLYQSGDGVSKNLTSARYWFNQTNTEGERNSFVLRGKVIRKVIINGLPQWGPEAAAVVAQTSVLAEEGNAEAQNDLGEMIERGIAGQADFSLAAAWFQKSAMQGYAAAQRNLGILYKNGRGVQRGTTQTISWLTNAAMQNDALAAYELGEIYQFGQIAPKNLSTAMRWYSIAAEHGSVPAQGALAYLYAQGDAVPVDDARAWQWVLISLAHDQSLMLSYDVVNQVKARITPDQLLQAKHAAREWWKNHASSPESTLPL